MRTNNVRQAWKIDHPDSAENRSFYDRSIWESRNIKDEETLKRLMRGAIKYSSAVCVLVGTDAWHSRWVKYEISRAVVDERGLLAVHFNGLNHIERRAPDPLGYNPLEVMGIFRSVSDRYYLYEKNVVVDPTNGQLGWEWRQYADYTDSVPLPPCLPRVGLSHVMPLSCATRAYDYVAELGHKKSARGSTRLRLRPVVRPCRSESERLPSHQFPTLIGRCLPLGDSPITLLPLRRVHR
jgi:hypothetical protein